MSKIYARKLTKEDLQKHGVKEITKDCKVTFNNGRVLEKEEDFTKNKQGYLTFSVYDLDENGNRIKRLVKRRSKYTKKLYYNYIYKIRTICLHRAMYAWHYNEVPQGYCVDHISNKHDTLADNKLENLQLLTPRDNLVKERTNIYIRELSCRMTLPLSYYEEKLITFINKYNSSKDQDEKNLLRGQISNYRAKIKYWKNHEEEYIKNKEIKAIKDEELKAQKAQKVQKELIKSIKAKAHKAQKERLNNLKQYKKIADEAKALYKQDPSSENSYNWHLAAENYYYYLKTHPFKTQEQLFLELNSDQVRN